MAATPAPPALTHRRPEAAATPGPGATAAWRRPLPCRAASSRGAGPPRRPPGSAPRRRARPPPGPALHPAARRRLLPPPLPAAPGAGEAAGRGGGCLNCPPSAQPERPGQRRGAAGDLHLISGCGAAAPPAQPGHPRLRSPGTPPPPGAPRRPQRVPAARLHAPAVGDQPPRREGGSHRTPPATPPSAGRGEGRSKAPAGGQLPVSRNIGALTGTVPRPKTLNVPLLTFPQLPMAHCASLTPQLPPHFITWKNFSPRAT